MQLLRQKIFTKKSIEKTSTDQIRNCSLRGALRGPCAGLARGLARTFLSRRSWKCPKEIYQKNNLWKVCSKIMFETSSVLTLHYIYKRFVSLLQIYDRALRGVPSQGPLRGGKSPCAVLAHLARPPGSLRISPLN